jgi:hypothetical protein
LHATYGDKVQFYVVYIREAHALDSRQPSGGGSNPVLEDPRTLLERRKVAEVCITKLELESLPALVDDVDDTVNSAYAAWPDRIYLIGADGKIAYHGGRGPFGFLPDELDAAIRAELGLVSN